MLGANMLDTKPGETRSPPLSNDGKAPNGPGTVMLEAGSIVGGYRIERKLAEGGMGTVYVANHVILPRQVALKVLRPELTDTALAREGLLQEGRILESLVDARITRVYDAGYLEPGRPWIAMELLAGECLADLMARTPKMSVPEVAQIVGATVDALLAAHQNGVVHSDVKPENVMVQLTPAGPVAKMIDWGIARVASTTVNAAFAVGTPHYMSPEQIRGEAIDPRADVYALGVLAYELIAGRTPFNGETPTDIALQHLRSKPRALREIRRDVPPAIESLIATMLAKEAAERPTLETVRACFGLVSDAALIDDEEETETSVEVVIDYSAQPTEEDDVVRDGVPIRWTPPHGRPTSEPLSNQQTLRFTRVVHSGGKQVASAAGVIRKYRAKRDTGGEEAFFSGRRKI